MKKAITITTSIMYIILVLSFSFGIVVYSSAIHKPFVKPEQQTYDKSITRYLITGNIENLNRFTKNEQSHMLDVRHLVDTMLIICLGGLVVWFLLFRKLKKSEQLTSLLSPFLAMYTLGGLTSLFAKDFTNSFEVFHKIFFPQGNYAFPFNSLLIQTYPEKFFFAMTLSAACLFILSSLIVVLAIKKE